MAALLFLLLLSSAAACDRCVHQSKAAHFSRSTSLSSGACGYASLAASLGGGKLAGGVSSLYKEGAGCGACYQIRCTDASVCSGEGTSVVLTDLNQRNLTDTEFVLSRKALMSLARGGKGRDILKREILDVEYKRIPCMYPLDTALRVEESSRSPNNLVIKVLYQGGQTEIVAIDVATVGSYNWTYLSRDFGAVWNTSRAPPGPLQFRFVVTSGYDGKWLWAKSVLPADWKPGAIYSTGLRMEEIAQEGCFPCSEQEWQ